MAKLTKHLIDTEIEYPSKGYRTNFEGELDVIDNGDDDADDVDDFVS